MALIGFEGFEDISVQPQGNLSSYLAWRPFVAGVGSPTTLGFGFGGSFQPAKSASLNSVAGSSLSFAGGTALNAVLQNPVVTAFTGFRLFTPASFNFTFIRFFDVASIQCAVGFSAAGKLIAINSAGATVATGTTTLVPSSTYYVEIKVTISLTVGEITIRLNGVPELSATSISTQLTANASFNIFGFNATVGFAVDDLYLCDATGPAPWNTFLGPCIVQSFFPFSNAAVTWTPSTGSNFSQVNEASADADANYNSTPTSGNADMFNHLALAYTPSSVFGVRLNAYAHKDDITNTNLQTQLTSGATTVQGASNSMATAYQVFTDYFATDPNTAAQWLPAAINATTFGYKHV